MKIINISYSIDQKQFEEKFDQELKFNAFILLLEVTHNISIQFYEVFYMDQKLASKYYNLAIKDIIRIDPNPHFLLKRIIKTHLEDKKSLIVAKLKNQIYEIFIKNIEFKVLLNEHLNKFMNQSKYKDFKFHTLNDEVVIKITGTNEANKLYYAILDLKRNIKEFEKIDVCLKSQNVNSKMYWENTTLYNKLFVS